MVTRTEDGTVEAAELRDHDESEVGELRSLDADLSLLLATEDIERAGADLEPGARLRCSCGKTRGPARWHRRFAIPAGSSSGRIPTQALIAAVEEDREAAEAGA